MPYRARTDLWEPRGSNLPGPPGPLCHGQTSCVRVSAPPVKQAACLFPLRRRLFIGEYVCKLELAMHLICVVAAPNMAFGANARGLRISQSPQSVPTIKNVLASG